MFRKYLFLIVFCFTTILWVTGFPALAQVMLEQGRISVQVKPGEKLVNSITAINRGQVPVNLRVYLEDFVYTSPYQGGKEFMPTGSNKRSCASWISFSPPLLKLDSKDKATINYTINVPEEARGGYNAVLFVENASSPTDARIGVKIVTRVGSLFFLETSDSVRKAKIDKITLDKNKLTGQITNQGDVILVIRGTYYILDRKGMAAERGDVEALYLPPQKTANFSLAMPGKLAVGTYTLVLTFDLGEGVSAVVEVDVTKAKDGSFRILTIRS